MMKLIPILLLLLGTGAGAGAGFYLRPEPAAEPAASLAASPAAGGDEAAKTPAAQAETGHDSHDEDGGEGEPEYVKLNNQFIVPVVAGDRVASLVVLSLGVEIGAGQKERLYSIEPKLRDTFLQELFSFANMGGFGGDFTSARNLGTLRNGLREAATLALGDLISDVLIIEIARQDN